MTYICTNLLMHFSLMTFNYRYVPVLISEPKHNFCASLDLLLMEGVVGVACSRVRYSELIYKKICVSISSGDKFVTDSRHYSERQLPYLLSVTFFVALVVIDVALIVRHIQTICTAVC